MPESSADGPISKNSIKGIKERFSQSLYNGALKFIDFLDEVDRSVEIEQPTTVEEQLDLLDILQTEIGSLTPEQRVQVDTMINTASALVESFVGNIIPPEQRIPKEDLRRRTIIADVKTVPLFANEWAKSLKWKEINRYGVTEPSYMVAPYKHKSTGNFLIAGSFFEYDWLDDLDDFNRDMSIMFTGSAEEARKHLEQEFGIALLLHEFIHFYQPEDIPYFLAESAAYYYQTQSATLNSDAHIQHAELYTFLQDKYGDDVTKLVFGKEIPKQTKRNILRDITTARIKQSFPQFSTTSVK